MLGSTSSRWTAPRRSSLSGGYICSTSGSWPGTTPVEPAVCKRHDLFVGLEQFGQVGSGRIRPAAADVLVVVGCIRRQEHPTPFRVHAHDLLAGRMAGRRLDRQAGGKVRTVGVEQQALVEICADNVDHIFDFVAVRQERVANVAPDRHVNLGLLHVDGRIRDQLEISRVVIVHVRDDHVADRIGLDADQAQGLDRATKQLTVATAGGFLGEPQIDDEVLVRPLRYPDEVVHVHRPVVRIADHEMIAAAGGPVRVSDGKEFVVGKSHDCVNPKEEVQARRAAAPTLLGHCPPMASVACRLASRTSPVMRLTALGVNLSAGPERESAPATRPSTA